MGPDLAQFLEPANSHLQSAADNFTADAMPLRLSGTRAQAYLHYRASLVTNKDWFRSETWDQPTRAAFESKLARSRAPSRRAQYLRIQGLTLIETNQHQQLDAGRALLQRVITDYPDQLLEVAGAHAALADSYLREQRVSEAIAHLRVCLILESGRSFGHKAELLLAEALLAHDPTDSELGEVATLLDQSANKAFFHSEVWRIAVARARRCDKLGDAEGAGAHASEALALLADNTPKLPRHPSIGLIRTDAQTIDEMQQLARRSGR